MGDVECEALLQRVLQRVRLCIQQRKQETKIGSAISVRQADSTLTSGFGRTSEKEVKHKQKEMAIFLIQVSK